ncbi:MAG TPA: aminoglycoside phosphotransferase family protein, partial [Solirubrobacteraceae bacterium]
DEATAILAGVMARLWRPPPPGAAPAGYAGDLDAARPTGPLSEALLARARATLAELLRTAGTPRLLHGDLHHHNVLSAGRGRWAAIDPKGVVGDPGSDVTPLLHNPVGLPDPGALAERRVARLAAELGMDRDRLRAWGFVGAVLSEVWTVEATGRVDGRALGVALALG